MAKRNKVPEVPVLNWLRDLPEVGEPIRRMADDEEKRLAYIAKLRREIEIELGELAVLRDRALTTVKQEWRAEDIANAERWSRG